MTSTAKHLILLLLPIFLISCGDTIKLDKNFSIETNATKNSIKNGEELTISVIPKKDIIIDSVMYALDGKRLGGKNSLKKFTSIIKIDRLGQHQLTAEVFTDNGAALFTKKINILSPTPPKLYGYRIINRYPHQTDAYTQGLEFVGDTLYESTGQYGKSKLRKLNYETGEVLKEVALDNNYFAEGMTILDDKIYQLTWRENVGFIYDKNTFEKTGTFSYNSSKEGWGLANDGNIIYKSDGTSKIWSLNKSNLSEQNYIEPTDNKKVTSKLNELEWVNGKIYANNYQVDLISIINPNTGAIEGIVDLRSLKDQVQEGLDPANDVLNGIAYKENENRLFVTGKHWNTLFEIEIFEK
ncbi:glutaminyl-peptide cyclotransferase [Dokdonia sp. Hel_I_53]|uniref:glutaminyl-peptide cyclotransferase n=1 Tax=Dokdonia sp. Hel_I_53 TaxID=1566287 RepID=UPI00119C48BD|nr:glutaminyl-peptide cyclotransferase [Dokdonia sp. Hel_I_53]TVZ50939.1 glutaminyl-peptide cyclotransferase [Dokdonia sp. Hel_I_53]